MRIKQLLLALFFFSTSLSMAKAPNKRSFTEFGYPKNMISFGQKNGATYFFKDDPLRDYEKSGFYLEIMVSPLIQKEKSHLNFKLGEIPVMSLDLKEYTDTIKIYIPLHKNSIESGYIKLSIEPILWFPNEDCMDIDQKSVWMRVSDNSYFHDIKLEPVSEKKSWNISTFIPSVQAILIPKTNFDDYVSVLSYLHFFFLHTQGKNIPIKFLDQSIPRDFHHALILGETNEINKKVLESLGITPSIESNGLALNYLEYQDSSSNKSIYLNNLFVTGKSHKDLEKLIRILFTDLGKSTLLNESFSVFENAQKTETIYKFETKRNYNLEALGMDEEVISGKGRIRKNLMIPEFLAKPSLNTISLDISASYSPVTGNQKAYLNVFINNKLLQTYQLDGSGLLEKKISARKAQFGASNYIGFEFIYIPEGGMCDDDSPDFFAQINPALSSVSLQYHTKVPETFHAFPANFHGKETNIIYDYQITLDDITNFSKIISLLNLRDTEALGVYLPKIHSLKNLEEKLPNSNLVLVSKSQNNYDKRLDNSPFLRFSESKVIYRSDELDLFFSYYRENSLNYVQLFTYQGVKILKFNILSKDNLAFERLMEGFREQFLTNTGNVMVSNSERYFFFDLNQTDLKNQKMESEAKFNSFWKNYRIMIISILISLLIVLLIYIYKKSRFAQKSIEDARK